MEQKQLLISKNSLHNENEIPIRKVTNKPYGAIITVLIVSAVMIIFKVVIPLAIAMIALALMTLFIGQNSTELLMYDGYGLYFPFGSSEQCFYFSFPEVKQWSMKSQGTECILEIEMNDGRIYRDNVQNEKAVGKAMDDYLHDKEASILHNKKINEKKKANKKSFTERIKGIFHK